MKIKIAGLCFLALGVILAIASCSSNGKKSENTSESKIAKGLYSFGPELKIFSDCTTGSEYWVADSAKTLELAYHDLGFEKPYLPVYVEVEYYYIKSDTMAASANFDSTMVVTKLIKMSKDAPAGPCVLK